MFGRYYRREKITYWFIALLPLILFTECALYVQLYHSHDQDTMEMMYSFFLPLASVFSMSFVVIQLISCFIFGIRKLKLTKEQRVEIKETVSSGRKTGRILQTKSVLIYYGMFSKNILFTEDIAEMMSIRDSEKRNVKGGSMIIDSDYIRVIKKFGKCTDIICPMKVLQDGYMGELPWNSFYATAITGILFLFMGIYPIIMGLFVDKSDIIETVLFYTGYEWVFWLISIILFGILAVVTYIWKIRHIDPHRISGMVFKTPLLFYFVIIFCMFLYVIFHDIKYESEWARADLKQYSHGQCNEKIIYTSTFGDATSSCGSENIYYYLDANKVEYVSIVSDYREAKEKGYTEIFKDEGWEDYFLLLDGIVDMEQGKIYQIQYLENTGIVVDAKPLFY